jgi:hypothetical protein
MKSKALFVADIRAYLGEGTIMSIKQKAEKIVPLIIACVIVLIAGCATMYAPESDKVTITSNPEGADVYYGAQLLGTTPLTYAFKREVFERKTLILRKHGYKNQEVLLAKTLEKKALYNIAFITTTFGVTSWAIDANSGRMVQYSPDSYLIDMEKSDQPSEKDHAGLQRLRFVVLNQSSLMKDISLGDGEYLRTYYDARPAHKKSENYRQFLSNISAQSVALLSTLEPVKFYNQLENI